MSKTKPKPVETEPTRIEFETFNKPSDYSVSSLKQKEPDCFNGIVSIRKYRVTVELIDEPREILIERLRTLWRNNDNSHHYKPLRDAGKELGVELDFMEAGIHKKKSKG